MLGLSFSTPRQPAGSAHSTPSERFASAAQRVRRAAGVQTPNGKEETGELEQVDQPYPIDAAWSLVITGIAVRWSDRRELTYRQRSPARLSRTWLQQFRISRYLPAVPGPDSGMQPRGHANDSEHTARRGKQHHRCSNALKVTHSTAPQMITNSKPVPRSATHRLP